MEISNFYNYGTMNQVEPGATQINNYYNNKVEQEPQEDSLQALPTDEADQETADETASETAGETAEEPTSEPAPVAPVARVARRLSHTRSAIWQQIEQLIPRGDWQAPASAQTIRTLMATALGLEGRPLTPQEQTMSQTLWHMLEEGRGDRVRITWQNLVGYFAERGYFPRGKGSPSLNYDFFSTRDGYSNIDKGKPSNPDMPAALRTVLPLFDTLASI